MASLLQSIGSGIRNGISGTLDTVNLSWRKFSSQVTSTTGWQKTSAIAGPYIRQGASYYPDALKFTFSKDFAAGATTAVLAGALYNKVHG